MLATVTKSTARTDSHLRMKWRLFFPHPVKIPSSLVNRDRSYVSSCTCVRPSGIQATAPQDVDPPLKSKPRPVDVDHPHSHDFPDIGYLVCIIYSMLIHYHHEVLHIMVKLATNFRSINAYIGDFTNSMIIASNATLFYVKNWHHKLYLQPRKVFYVQVRTRLGIHKFLNRTSSHNDQDIEVSRASSNYRICHPLRIK